MSRAGGKAQPASRRVRSHFVGKLALEYEQLGTLFVGDDSEVRLPLPEFETHSVREAGLLVERLVSNGWNGAWLPYELFSVEDDVAPVRAWELS